MALRIGLKIHRYLGQTAAARASGARPRLLLCRPKSSSVHVPADADYFGASEPRRLPPSSTQSALTVPLRLPRLANPYPERLKTYPSDTLADDDKARLMHEQAKLAPLQPRLRAVRQLHGVQQWRAYSTQPPAALRAATLADLEQCDAILARLRAQFPEYRALRRPVFVPGSREEREFVRSTLRYIAKHKAGGRRTPAPFPSYSEVKTFVREPRAVRKFSTGAVQQPALNGLHEHCSSAGALHTPLEGVHKQCLSVGALETPLEGVHKHCSSVEALEGVYELCPSVKALETPLEGVHKHCSSVEALGGVHKHCPTARASQPAPKRCTANSRLLPPPGSRPFSSGGRFKDCKPDKKKTQGVCKTLKSAGCADPWPTKCAHVHEASTCRKQTAPYPSYSECMGDAYEEEPSECKLCPWRRPPATKTSGSSSSSGGGGGKKAYSTCTLAPKQKRPCQSPHTGSEPCDYEGTAQKHDALRHRRPVPRPSQPARPATGGSGRSRDKKAYSTVAAQPQQPQQDTVADRIRGWLRSWHAGSDRVRITRATDAAHGRETYIIEIQEAWGGLERAKGGDSAAWGGLEQVKGGDSAAWGGLEQVKGGDSAAWGGLEQAKARSSVEQVTGNDKTARSSVEQVKGNDASSVEVARSLQTTWTSAQQTIPVARNQTTAWSTLERADTTPVSCAESKKKKPGKLPGGGCPPVKKKTEVVGDDKKKCRQRKKRKLPSCQDVGKDPTSKKKTAAATAVDKVLAQQTQEIAALQEPLTFEPFKLKPQFWRL